MLLHQPAVLIAFLVPAMLPAQVQPTQHPTWIKVSPQQAASHLLKGAEPKYPPFALTAGIEGTVRICAQISTDGHLGFAGPFSGPPSLLNAAFQTMSQLVYRPFTSGGKLVPAHAVIDIPFKLPDGVPAHTYAFPNFKLSDFIQRLGPVGPAYLPAEVRAWLRKTISDEIDGGYSGREKDSIVANAINSASAELIARGENGARLYLFNVGGQGMCGATGNCFMALAEVNGQNITLAASTSGWGYALHRRPESQFPDVFIATNMSAGESDVVGFGEVGGMWGPLYEGALEYGPVHEAPTRIQCN